MLPSQRAGKGREPFFVAHRPYHSPVFAAKALGSKAADHPESRVPGYTYRHGVCQPVRHLGYGNPVSGAVSGEAAGAARGNASSGSVGAVVGGAVGTASGAITGTANMLTGH